MWSSVHLESPTHAPKGAATRGLCVPGFGGGAGRTRRTERGEGRGEPTLPTGRAVGAAEPRGRKRRIAQQTRPCHASGERPPEPFKTKSPLVIELSPIFKLHPGRGFDGDDDELTKQPRLRASS